VFVTRTPRREDSFQCKEVQTIRISSIAAKTTIAVFNNNWFFCKEESQGKELVRLVVKNRIQ